MLPRRSTHSEAIGPGVTGGPLAHPVPAEPGAARARHAPLAPAAGGEPLVVDPAALPGGAAEPRKHTQNPYVTGTSVLGITYADGVMLAADTLGSYGSTKRYKSFERLFAVNAHAAVGAGGELSDLQALQRLLAQLADEDYCADDGHALSPAEVHSFLCRVLYNRRCKMDPLWSSVVVGGVHPGTGAPFLGTVAMIGTSYVDGTVATGFGNALARPLLRERHRPDMPEAEAAALLHDCLRVLYYRDKQSINKFQVARITKAGVSISEPFALDTAWGYAAFQNPSKDAVGTW